MFSPKANLNEFIVDMYIYVNHNHVYVQLLKVLI